METATALRLLAPEKYFRHFLSEGVRLDGRSLAAARPARLSWARAVPEASEVALVRLGGTLVQARVALRVGSPSATAPQSGDLEVQIITPALCGRSHGAKRSDETLALEGLLKAVLVASGFLDCRALGISSGKLAWQVGLEVVVLSDTGNLEDAVLAASVAALQRARLPRLEVEDGVAYLSEEGGIGDALPLEGELQSVTLGLFGDDVLRDPSAEERSFLDAVVTVVHNGQGRICAVHKGAGKAASLELLDKCVDVALGCPPLIAPTAVS